MAPTPDTAPVQDQARANLRLALILAGVALAFGAGFAVKIIFGGV